MPEDLLEVIAMLMDWRRVHPFQCDAVYLDKPRHVTQHYELHADPRHSSYAARNETDGKKWSYDDATRVTVAAGSEVPYFPYQISSNPGFVQPAFPLSLPVWGRKQDMFYLAGVKSAGDDLNVLLEGRGGWSGYTGSLLVDRVRRVVVRFDAPDRLVTFEGIKPARPLYEAKRMSIGDGRKETR